VCGGWKSARRTEHRAVARTQAKLVSRSRRGLRPLSRTSKPSGVSAIQTKVWLDSVAPAARLWRDPHLEEAMSRERRTSFPRSEGTRNGNRQRRNGDIVTVTDGSPSRTKLSFRRDEGTEGRRNGRTKDRRTEDRRTDGGRREGGKRRNGERRNYRDGGTRDGRTKGNRDNRRMPVRWNTGTGGAPVPEESR